jgi:ribonuclease BN (tRNA processing enzyme)
MRRFPPAVLVAAVALSLCFAAAPARAGKTQVVLLGTGNPNADPAHSGPAVAVVVDGLPYLFDCGPGVVRRAAAAFQKGVSALKVTNLKTLFVTHLHSDHTAGYPDLILTPWVLGRDAPLEVYGPPGIRKMTRHILKAYREDIQVRLRGLEPANNVGYKVRVHEIRPGVVFRDGNIVVKAFPVRHGEWKHAFGFRIETPDRVVVISGDRGPSSDIAEYCRGCDLLIHEVYSIKGWKSRKPEWRKYHADVHTSSRELGELAAKVRPGLVVLYHELLWGSTPEELLEEIREVYDGKVVFGNDLDVF